ncbi:hypothetical protein GCM10022381_26150 [Leifsonia kafniensis]|uniref:Uncharacterized protein n=1 Tax=Leifsonia kafniensis TaxID=475957 RepID=A0ABP7KQ69_9MICO
MDLLLRSHDLAIWIYPDVESAQRRVSIDDRPNVSHSGSALAAEKRHAHIPPIWRVSHRTGTGVDSRVMEFWQPIVDRPKLQTKLWNLA